MRVLAVVSACLACAGHGHQVLKTSPGPGYHARLSRQGATHPSRASLASLLLMMRGGKSGFEDAKRGGFAEPPPMALSRSRAAPKTTGDTYEVPDAGKKEFAKQVGAKASSDISGTHKDPSTKKLRKGSPGQIRKNAVLVQGGSLKTWSYRSSLVDRVQVHLTTDGRPLDADIHLWEGPDNTPTKMRVYSEDGSTRPFSAVIATPGGGANTVAIYNIGQIEFPLSAEVIANVVDEPKSDFSDTSMIVQGGALRTFNFDNSVEAVEITLKTDGRPLNARIEMLQGPNNNKQVIELYSEDGLERPFFAIIDTLGTGNVVRVVNTAPMEFPMAASVQPHRMIENMSPLDPILGGN